MLKSFTLSNGIKVATYRLPDLKSIHLQISAKGGSIMENPENNGIAHFMEHMLVQGTPSYPTVEEFSSFIEGLAGSYGAQTEKLLIGFNIHLPATQLETAVKIGSEVFFEPLFVEGAMEKERQAVLNEITQKMDSHYYMLSKFFRQARYKAGSPLILDTGGDIEVVKKLTRDDLMEFWKKIFLPKNTYVLVTGNFNQEELEKYLEEYFKGHLSEATFPGFPKMTNRDLSERGVYIRNDNKLHTAYTDLTFPTVTLDSPIQEQLMLNLSLVILGRLRNSRLFKLLRYEKGLVYDVSTSSSLLPGMGYIYVTTEAPLEHLDEVVTLIARELQFFKSVGPTQEELDFARNYLINQWQMSFDHPSSVAGWIESGLIWRDKIYLPEDYIEIVKKITKEDLINHIQKNWDFSRLNLTLQGPIENSEENRAKFEKLMAELV